MYRIPLNMLGVERMYRIQLNMLGVGACIAQLRGVPVKHDTIDDDDGLEFLGGVRVLGSTTKYLALPPSPSLLAMILILVSLTYDQLHLCQK